MTCWATQPTKSSNKPADSWRKTKHERETLLILAFHCKFLFSPAPSHALHKKIFTPMKHRQCKKTLSSHHLLTVIRVQSKILFVAIKASVLWIFSSVFFFENVWFNCGRTRRVKSSSVSIFCEINFNSNEIELNEKSVLFNFILP